MKKTLSALLAGALLATTIPMASAASDLTEVLKTGLPAAVKAYVNNENNPILVNSDIKVKLSSDTTYIDNMEPIPPGSLPSFSYQATLDMESVRSAFLQFIGFAADAIDNQYPDKNSAQNKTLKSELDALPVTGQFIVTIANPDEMIIPEYIKVNNQALTGFNAETFNAFKEVSREYKDNKLTITIDVKEGITKKVLEDNLNTHLADLTLTCVDDDLTDNTEKSVTVDGPGTYTLIGTVEGYTTIGSGPDDSFKLYYKAVQSGNDPTNPDDDEISETVKILRPTAPDDDDSSHSGGGGGPTVSTFTVTTEVDGKAIDKKSSSTTLTYNPYDLDTPAKDGYLFAGWYNKATDEYIPGSADYNKTTVITAKWIETGINIDFVIDGEKAEVNSTKIPSVNVTAGDIVISEDGTTVKTSEIDVNKPSGYKFLGWYLDAECTIPANADHLTTEDITFYGKLVKRDGSDILDMAHHYAYIIGYPDGYVRPTQNISREEVATIFFRLLTEEARAELLKNTNSFSDVENTRWSNNAISTMEGYGLITGYADGTFKPAADITRAEFVTMVSRFYEIDEAATSTFTDVSGHWAEKYIANATSKGWINGYEDGTFKPDKYITRAEAMTIVNHLLNRKVTAKGLHADAVQWTDNTSDAWYYYDVLEATNSHNCEDRAEGVLEEIWTECVENYDWSILEK